MIIEIWVLALTAIVLMMIVIAFVFYSTATNPSEDKAARLDEPKFIGWIVDITDDQLILEFDKEWLISISDEGLIERLRHKTDE